ncbi:hypothetical protein EXN48_14695 [Clostridium botulinum]|nr:hypothetical protein [Clostridium botulinum]NFC90767.1 hypothetical protein [Clostridium botulinum]NFC99652.1 hypothetical protein [Clostridium botulinum]NFD38497.1 hypothetical protein [Clostridium botulinum]NFD42164.1 hypothetical protein [Clostridium botulinum]
MSKNEGKYFESDFKASIPNNCWGYRLRDSAGTWQGGNNARFTPSNICDFIVMGKENLYLLELKSIKNVSLPFSCIRENQVKELSKIDKSNIKAMFIINFRSRERTYMVDAKKVKGFIESADRKSIPLNWCKENGIEIEGIKKRTRFKYKLDKVLV